MEEELYNMDNDEVRYRIQPDFNLLYELFMPTGKKIKNTAFIMIIIGILNLILFANIGLTASFSINITETLTILDILKYATLLVLILLVVKVIFHIVFQIAQYKHISYTFYSDHMVYEDDFLNQHRKNIEYKNVKEVEIRRTIWDRILGYGVIIIYTNAENRRSNGLVIYGVKDPKVSYEKIDKLVHSIKQEETISEIPLTNHVTSEENYADNIKEDVAVEQSENHKPTELNSPSQENNQETEASFKESLKNIK